MIDHKVINADIQAFKKHGLKAELISDGFHTFKELYTFRKLYNALIFNEWARQSKYEVHKSLKHADGELCFGGGWFVVMAMLPTGQISQHYENEDWYLFKVNEAPQAQFFYDGHTAQDVENRIEDLITTS